MRTIPSFSSPSSFPTTLRVLAHQTPGTTSQERDAEDTFQYVEAPPPMRREKYEAPVQDGSLSRVALGWDTLAAP